MPPSLLLLVLLFCFLPGSRGANPEEIQIILDLKTSLGITNATPGFQSWSSDPSSSSPCSFSGILCDSRNSVAEIDLSNRGILGTFPFRSVCRLPSLSKLSLGNNNLTGELTADLTHCTKLQHLDLASNHLGGTVPDLSNLRNLKVLNLSDNQFAGIFPWDSLGNLTGLVALSLGDNGFDPSPFPEAIKNMKELNLLYLSHCNLHGEIPPWIGNLTALVDLEFADNFISGGIPPEITKLKRLYQLEMYNNSIAGELPSGFGNLSELAFFDASMNFLEGDLSELRFLTKLVSLQLFFNGFAGQIPPEFGEFRELVNLSLYSNMLSGELPEKLGSWSEFNFIDVSTNFLTGKIPPDMCRMGKMDKLLLLQNKFTGEIPASYGNCSSLTRFRVSNNTLSGEVPAGIWSLPNVNIIDLAINRFEGPIGAGIGDAKSLFQLFIGDNQFSGAIPKEIGDGSKLVSIDASFNQFSGNIPAEIGNLQELVSLNLEQNSFSGEIPESLGQCVQLNTMNLAKNSLSGAIPASLGKLPSLNSLVLSNNQLSGEIPGSLAFLKLSSLDLSNNRLSGVVPPGISIDAFNESFIGNPDLCGDGIRFLRRCSSEHGGGREKFRTLITSLIAAVTILLASLVLIVFLRRKRSDGGDDRKDSWNLKSFRILTFDEQEIINSIKQENLIGKGASGNVYRVSLGSGKVVAVKHIWMQPDPEERGTAAMLGDRKVRGAREFDAEVGTLSSIRHVNIVKLYCSITCEGWSLLVYEHLPNGSLWDRLHTCEGGKLGLDWETRVEIALGAARGLEYLHHGCDRPIVHRDVKSSNILLDEEFKPRIADFGLAKILRSSGGGGKESSTHVIAGTHGYIAPEYAYTWKVDVKSDVYSFGVVLMELVTGKRPIEQEYGDHKDIVYWVSQRMTGRENVLSMVDRKIPEWAKDEALKVLRVAVICTARLPSMRPSMRTVVQMLEEVAASRVVVNIDGKDEKKGEGGYRIEVQI